MKSVGLITDLTKLKWLLLSFAVLILAAWLHFNKTSSIVMLIPSKLKFSAEIISFAIISFVITNFLNNGFTMKKSHFRIAFLLAFSIGLIFFTVSSRYQISINAISYLPSMAIASFLGSFIASIIDKGYWENNSPPSQVVQEQILLQHKNNMGKTIRLINKRILDVILALISLIISAPIWLLVTLLIWYEDPGPVLFVKNSVGLGGKNFKQFKFRSMVLDAERTTGPISGYENDERVLFLGQFLRKTALDEIPQLVNILIGDMSYVGPRPQRTVLVNGYLQDLPEYVNRHRVRPGLAGLAQVADSYYITPQEKLGWDLEYIRRVNTWFDVKLVLAAFYLVFVLRWRSEPNPEEKIRRLLGIDKP
jgi:lipopolysaccharide/colanic/teichoic acid biosynthesis glycosyltransferase